MSNSNSSNQGCGCVGIVVLILVLWALWVGLPTPWGTYNVDIIPPRIWRMDLPTPSPTPAP